MTTELPPAVGASTGAPISIMLRPGVRFPDHSAVNSDVARAALDDIVAAFGIDSWDGVAEDEDRVRRAILEHYALSGRAPSLARLAEVTQFAPERVRGVVQKLRERDLVVLDGEAIAGAYPLTDWRTEHTVRVGEHAIHAMCAIDALGVGKMYGRDVEIDSSCRASGAPIRVATAGNGTAVKSITPSRAVVWSGIRDTEGCAADTLCTIMAFFASDDALETWRKVEHPDTPGHRLTVEEAMQVGAAIFGPMLSDAAAGRVGRNGRPLTSPPDRGAPRAAGRGW